LCEQPATATRSAAAATANDTVTVSRRVIVRVIANVLSLRAHLL
jgi:hypothetical protein